LLPVSSFFFIIPPNMSSLPNDLVVASRKCARALQVRSAVFFPGAWSLHKLDILEVHIEAINLNFFKGNK